MKLSIKAARVNAGLTQISAATKIGCSGRQLMAYEAGKAYPPINVVQKMIEVYGVPYDDLIFAPQEAI